MLPRWLKPIVIQQSRSKAGIPRINKNCYRMQRKAYISLSLYVHILYCVVFSPLMKSICKNCLWYAQRRIWVGARKPIIHHQRKKKLLEKQNCAAENPIACFNAMCEKRSGVCQEYKQICLLNGLAF